LERAAQDVQRTLIELCHMAFHTARLEIGQVAPIAEECDLVSQIA
jgi:hypothetical protein